MTVLIYSLRSSPNYLISCIFSLLEILAGGHAELALEGSGEGGDVGIVNGSFHNVFVFYLLIYTCCLYLIIYYILTADTNGH